MTSNSTKLSDTREKQCSRCGASLPADAPLCWLCFAPMERKPGDSRDAQSVLKSQPADSMLQEHTASGFSLASLMMFVTLLCVVLGVSTIAPGIGIPLGIVLLVVWLRTAAVARRRMARGLTVTRSEKLHLFLESIATTLGLLAVICLAGCAAFFAACFACVMAWTGSEAVVGEQAAYAFAWIVFGVVALAIALPMLWWIVKVIRRRWRRDIGEPD